MDSLRIYLLGGLLLHKAVWEVMKRAPLTTPVLRPPTFRLRAVKAVKILILLAILAQTCLPDVVPITPEPQALRIAGFILFTGGLALALAGRIHLGNNWLDIESAAVKSGQVLVSKGIYRYVRHPIYGGDLLLLAGLELALNSWLVVLVPFLAIVVFRRALLEEHTLEHSLPGYGQYCRRTRRFLPFLV